MIADMSLLRHILRAFVCHFISECSGGHNSSTVKLQNLQRNYSGLKRNKIFAFLPSAHVQVPESSRRAGSYFSMTPSWTSPCGHVAWLRPDTGTLVLVLVMVLPRAHEKPPIPIPSHTPSPLVSLSASLQCKRENATAVHKNPSSWAMAIFMRLNIFITKIALRGAPGLVVGGFSLSLNLRDKINLCQFPLSAGYNYRKQRQRHCFLIKSEKLEWPNKTRPKNEPRAVGRTDKAANSATLVFHQFMQFIK